MCVCDVCSLLAVMRCFFGRCAKIKSTARVCWTISYVSISTCGVFVMKSHFIAHFGVYLCVCGVCPEQRAELWMMVFRALFVYLYVGTGDGGIFDSAMCNKSQNVHRASL